MIGGQTLSTKQAEENFILSQNESNPVESAEAVETIEEITFIEAKTAQVDLKMKFTRLKKAMRKRSVSIF